jgi:hypothetical protein
LPDESIAAGRDYADTPCRAVEGALANPTSAKATAFVVGVLEEEI